MRSRLITLVVPMLVLAMGVVGTAAAAPGNSGERVDVIVVLHDGADARDAAADAAREHRAEVGFIYEHALQGFSASVPEGRLNGLQRDPRVDYIETDDEVSIQAQSTPTGTRRIFADTNTNLDIDSRDDHRVDVDVAIIDTGIDYEHPDLNVVGGVDCTTGGPSARDCESGGDDDHYHGTHVAGTVGAIDDGAGVVGVAPGARLWAVKVLDERGSGYESWVVAGIDWVAANADTIEVANMSLGGSGFSQAEYDAIQSAVDSGVAFAVAAGNDNDDARDYSPAAFNNALTVSALADFDGEAGDRHKGYRCYRDQDDTLADFSNWGPAVDIAAPGVCILSTFPIEQGEYGTISGTSMASPHAAGALALLASSNNPGDANDVYSLYSQVENAGNDNWTDDSGDGTQEPLLDVSNKTLFDPTLVAGSGDSGTTNGAPTSAFTYGCTELACDFNASTSSDSDGSIASYDWDFGDGNSGSGELASHTYAQDGTYTVTLTVTDDDGATGTSSQEFTVSSSSNDPSGYSLTANGYKDKGRHHAELSWSGTSAESFDIYVNGSTDDAIIVESSGDGWVATWSSDNRGGASYTFQVCDAGSQSNCSNKTTVVF